MTDENKKLLEDLQFRVRQVMFLCDSLREENAVLKKRIENQQQRISTQSDQLDRLNEKYNSLKIARTITAATVDVETAKSKLSKLVREVDKCINLLSS